jgi:hypothetical protein
MENLEKKVRFLSIYAVGSSLLMSAFVFSSFNQKEKKENFDEITVKRINVTDENGDIRMVLSNKDRQHSGRMNGKDWAKRDRQAGMIFFNEEGDECGGLVYGGKKANGKTVSGMSITMDKYKSDQVIQLLNSEYYNGDKAFFERGLKINSYPGKSDLDERNQLIEELKKLPESKERESKINKVYQDMGSVNRVFIGQTRGDSSGLFLADKTGKPRMMIYVDADGNPKLETFNDKGESINFLDKK